MVEPPTGAVTLLFYLYPVWVMLVTMGLDRRPPGWRLFVALLLALGGSAVVIVGGGEVEVAPLGILLALVLLDGHVPRIGLRAALVVTGASFLGLRLLAGHLPSLAFLVVPFAFVIAAAARAALKR